MKQKNTILTIKKKGRKQNTPMFTASYPASSPKKKGGDVTKIYKNICLF